jgi:hypothetical protein
MTTMAQICQVWGWDYHIPIIASNKYNKQYLKMYVFSLLIFFL